MKSKREDKKKDVSRELSQTIAAIKNLFGRCFNSMRLVVALSFLKITLFTNSSPRRVKPVFNGHKDSAPLMDILEFELDVIHIRIADLKDIAAEFNAGGESVPIRSCIPFLFLPFLLYFRPSILLSPHPPR